MATEDEIYPPAHGVAEARRLAIRSTVFESIAADPRPVSRAPRVLAVALGAASLGALLYSGLWGGAPAAWSATPDTLDNSATAAVASACEGSIAAAGFPLEIESARPLVAEARGVSQAVVSAGPTQVHVCVSGPTHAYSAVIAAEAIPAGAVGTIDAVEGYRSGGDPLRVITGRLRSDGRVIVTVADGTKVSASVGGGAFLAWWPSNADPVRVAVVLADGTAADIPVPSQDAPAPMKSGA